ncbi:MAG TPA: WG repeat-containing protein [Pyrinomonadaceae bacterium]
MFRTTLLRSRTPRRLAAAVCLSLATLLAGAAPAAGCSWDYPIWIQRNRDAAPLYRFIRDGKAGYIDREGRVVIEPQFDGDSNYAGAFHDGLMEVGVSSGEYVDVTGKTVIKDELYRGWQFSDGLAAALKEDGGKWGYIDPTGKFAISPRFQGYPGGYVSPFSEGRAWIEVAGRYGFIDKTGEFVVRPVFLHAESFRDGMARVVVEGPCGYSGDGPCPDFRHLGGPARPGRKVPPCKFTFVDGSGSVLKARFEAAKHFSEGTAPVKLGGKWGYADKSGRLVIEPQFDEAWPFSGGLARVRQGELTGLFGYIDAQGKYVVPPRFNYADDFSEGLAAVGDREYADEPGNLYYIDGHGRTVIKGPFALASHFFKGLAHVKLRRSGKGEVDRRAGRFAYIDAEGKTVFAYEVESNY